MSDLPIHQYLVAINARKPPKAFLDMFDRFVPNFPLLDGLVYIFHHSKKLSLSELRRMVESTLPPSVSFYVCIAPEGELVPNREAPQAQ